MNQDKRLEKKGAAGQAAGGRAGSTRQKLLQAARVQFANYGLRGATTKNIAATAHVAEVTLFRHFATKEELLKAVMEEYSGLSVFDDTLKSRLTWELKADLELIGSEFLCMTDAAVLPMLTSITEAIRSPEIRGLVAAAPRRQREFMTWYLTEQIQRGGCRELPDVQLAAQAFLAPFFEQSIAKLVYSDTSPSHTETVQQLVGLFIRGIQ